MRAQQLVVRGESSSEAVDLARRLKAAGAKMYGAFWCSHCQEQKAEFGAAAQKDLPYVECYPQGYHKVHPSTVPIRVLQQQQETPLLQQAASMLASNARWIEALHA